MSYVKISARIRATAMKDKLPDSVFLTKCHLIIWLVVL